MTAVSVATAGADARDHCHDGDVDQRARGRVIVVGSVNRDVTVTAPRFPLPGETVLGSHVTYGLGGKGANQAVAAARAGVEVLFVGTVGEDRDGEELTAALRGYGVDTSALVTTGAAATGSAHIVVDAAGENAIVVVPGANRWTSPEVVARLGPARRDVLVVQGEVPPETVLAVLERAREVGCRVVLNLAPFVPLPAATLAGLDVLVVNEPEAAAVLGSTPPRDLAAARDTALALCGLGVRHAVVTIGAGGAVLAADDVTRHVPAPRPERVVDTTGAGDATVGVLAAALALGHSLVDALRAAVVAGTRSVERPGAAASYPAFRLDAGGLSGVEATV